MLSKRKRTMIRMALEANAAASNRSLASQFKVDKDTIAAIRAEASGGENRRTRRRAVPPQISAAVVDSQDHPEAAAPVDPKAVLEAVAMDPNQSGTARVAAAKALLAMQKRSAETKAAERVDQVTERALALVFGGKK